MTIVRIEVALIRNKLENIPIIPVFLAELEFDDATKLPKFAPFDRNVTFPDRLHARDQSIDGL